MTLVLKINPHSPEPDLIAQAAACLVEGKLVAFPTETVYGLGGNALDPRAVERIFIAKGRPFQDPLIVHIAGLTMLELVVWDAPEVAYQLAEHFWPGPLTLILPRHANIPPSVSAGLDTVAVRMPDHPIACALIEQAGVPVAAPSANRFGRTSPTSAEHVLADLAGRIALVLDGGSPLVGLESTVLDVTQSPPVILRPGGVSLEQLVAVLGEVRLRGEPSIQVASKAMPSPGMLARHYAPRATLILFEGENASQVRLRMRSQAKALLADGRRVGVLAVDEDAEDFRDLGIQLAALGSTSDLSQVAHRLYAAIRELDAAGVEFILARSYGTQGLGLAILDRLRRAASQVVS
ncbi:MAG TPA: L-threonylcarbamoyladenylate synthase [Levilinea sp.]|nr:L-threonylcarbamoyladenylate synthase [Levilinea sp.]